MATVVQDMRPGPQEILKRVSPDFYRAAYEAGTSLSGYLNQLMPAEDYKDGLDGFQRLMKVAGIKLRSLPDEGVYADQFKVLEQSPELFALAPEMVARMWRRAQGQRAYTTDDDILNSWARPFADASGPRPKRIEPAIPLSEVVAVTTPIEGDAYRAMYIETSVAETRMRRVSEAAELPKAKLTTSENTVRLYKYGRAIDVSYEVLRRMRFDKLAIHVALMAIQTEADKLATVIDILVSGDGNNDTAAINYNLTALDATTTAGAMTLDAWLAFKLKFQNPYTLTTVITREAGALKLLRLNTGSANVPLTSPTPVGFGSFRMVNKNLADGVGLGVTDDAPATKLVGIDNRLAIERVTEIGANISEVQRWVTRQVQTLTMSETEGYAVLDDDAAKTLDYNA